MVQKAITVLVILIGLTAPSLATAEGLKHVPMWGSAGKHCYTFEQAKQLVVFDKEYDILLLNQHTMMQQLESLKEINELNEGQIASYERSITAYKEQTDELNEQLQAKIIEANQWRLKAEKRPVAPWAIAGVTTGTAIVLAVIVGVTLGGK